MNYPLFWAIFPKNFGSFKIRSDIYVSAVANVAANFLVTRMRGHSVCIIDLSLPSSARTDTQRHGRPSRRLVVGHAGDPTVGEAHLTNAAYVTQRRRPMTMRC